MEKILVTGGSGFIGSNFIRYMLQKYKKYHMVNIDLLTYAGNNQNLKDIEDNPNYTFIQGDITDRCLVDSVVSRDIDYIINFAAETHVDRSIDCSDAFVKTNILGTQVLLDISKEYNIKRYIQISTDEVYGALGKTGFFTEETPLSPNNPYSASKAGADLLVRSYFKTFHLPTNITRCSNNYGPYQFTEKLIPLMICKTLENKKLPIYGDGLNVRDWIHVMDHCNAIDLVLHKGKIGEIYNIGGNNERTNIDIVKLILKKLDKDEKLIHYVEDRLGHDFRYAVNASKIQDELGWQPRYNFEKGIQDTIKWYKDTQEWWKRINGSK